jgi:hypothetical protein
MSDASIQVGSRIKATWFDAKMNVGLAGAQMKCGATQISVTGTVNCSNLKVWSFLLNSRSQGI